MHRKTVSRYARLADEAAKPSKVTAGTEASDGARPSKVTAGNPAIRGRCEPFRAVIVEKLEAGLSAQRIYQDLVAKRGFSASCECVIATGRTLVHG